jgi:hypothetical protein
MAGDTGISGGTSVAAMDEGVASFVRLHGRELRRLDRALDSDLLKKTLRQGMPVMWTVWVDRPFYHTELNARTKERRKVSDWAEWIRLLEPHRKRKMAPPDRGSGHMTMIVGCNPKTREIAFSDSWGTGYEERWITWEEAEQISSGKFRVVRW